MAGAAPPTYEEVVSNPYLSDPPPVTGYPPAGAPYHPPVVGYQPQGGLTPTKTDITPLIAQGPPSYNAINSTSEVKGVDTGKTATTPSKLKSGSLAAGAIAFLVLLIFAALPCAMIYLGSTNLGGCPVREHVPLFCLISGCLALAAFVSFFLTMLSKEASSMFNFWVACFAICIAGHFGVQCWGSYLVFRYWSTWNTYEDFILENNLCDKDTFLMSFATLIIYWIIAPCLYAITKTN